MKDDKEVMQEVWDKEPCHNPLESAKWTWVFKSVKGSGTYLLTCVNSLWRYCTK